MKKYKNIEKIYGVIWAAIFLGLASWLKNIDWNAISWIFYILSGMCIVTIFR